MELKEGNTIRLSRKVDKNKPFKFGNSRYPDSVIINDKFLDFEILEVRYDGKRKIRARLTHEGETHFVWFLVDSLENNYNVVLMTT
jgi:hypothetical protein